MDAQRQWHRVFGMSLTDFFTGLPVTVETEKDLSTQQQLLDVVVVRKESGPLPIRLPDGLDDLARHNLISFKSFRESLDGWAMNELVGHYVNYRKLVSPTTDDLLPEDDFRLYAVAVRFPQNLARQAALEPVRPGVYRVRHFTGEVRLVVVHQLPAEEHNALLHLFSAQEEAIRYGARHYRPRSQRTSTFLLQLFERYREEGTPMPFTVEEFVEETIAKVLRDPKLVERIARDESVVEAVLENVPVEKRLEGIPAEARLKGLSPAERAELLARLREEGTEEPS